MAEHRDNILMMELKNSNITKLTLREIAILQATSEGDAYKKTAIKLGIAESTVKSHMKNIMTVLDAQNSTHAVAIAIREGVL